MNKVSMVKVMETILIRIMGVRLIVELMSGRVFHPVLITNVLGRCQNTWNSEGKGLTQYSSSSYMKGVMAQPWLVQDPVCPQTRTAARPMLRRLVVLGIVQKEEGI